MLGNRFSNGIFRRNYSRICNLFDDTSEFSDQRSRLIKDDNFCWKVVVTRSRSWLFPGSIETLFLSCLFHTLVSCEADTRTNQPQFIFFKVSNCLIIVGGRVLPSFKANRATITWQVTGTPRCKVTRLKKLCDKSATFTWHYVELQTIIRCAVVYGHSLDGRCYQLWLKVAWNVCLNTLRFVKNMSSLWTVSLVRVRCLYS